MGVQSSTQSDRGRLEINLDFAHHLSQGLSSRGLSLADILAVGQRRNLLSGIAGSLCYTHENLFGGSQKLNILLEKSVLNSNYLVSFKEPSPDGARSITIQNSLTPATSIHGIIASSPGSSSVSEYGGVRLRRLTARMDQRWDLNSNWSKKAGLMIEQIGPLDTDGNPILTDFYGCPITFSGNFYDKMLVAKLETKYSDSSDNKFFQYNIQMEQGLPVSSGWLFFYRLKAHAKQGVKLGPAFGLSSISGGTVIGNLAPHDAFPIGGFNSVRGYGEGALGSGRSCLVTNSELSFPLSGIVQGAIFADIGTDLGSGRSVPGDPAGARRKRGTGFGYGAGIRLESSIGPLRIDYAVNDMHEKCVYIGLGYHE